MNWTAIGTAVAVLGVVATVLQWLWPRNISRGGVRQKQNVRDMSHSGHVVQAGRDVIINNPAPAALPVNAPSAVSPTADIPFNKLLELLKTANNFTRRDLLKAYEHRTFHVLGAIYDVHDRESAEPTVFLRFGGDDLGIVRFQGRRSGLFDYIHDESWYLDCIAPLSDRQVSGVLVFDNPLSYEVKMRIGA